VKQSSPTRHRQLLPVSIALGLVFIAHVGRSLDLQNYTISGGGGSSVSGDLKLEATIGQAGAGGSLTAGEFSIATGFWPTVLRSSILGNISTRLRVQTGDNVLIGGFILSGTQPKKVIVRAIGPSSGVDGHLQNPTLELYGPAGLITSNDNWQDAANRDEIIASTIPPANDLESAIVATLPANGSAYTAVVRGVDNGTGVGLVEVYDLDRAVDSKLANISTRGFVQRGDDVMIGGLIVLGEQPQKVIVRAIGPSLPIDEKLEDPLVELFNSNGVSIGANDNWRDTQQAEIEATTIPPSNDLESAIVTTLSPGAYTAVVRGVNATTGVAVVEVYALQ
jgi:hypothetical protein